jgi:hypothetical protein
MRGPWLWPAVCWAVSIGVFSTAEAALSEQETASAKEKAPRKRQMVAKADVAAQPEPR